MGKGLPVFLVENPASFPHTHTNSEKFIAFISVANIADFMEIHFSR